MRSQSRAGYLLGGILLIGLDFWSKNFFSQQDAVVRNTGVVFGLLPGWWWEGVLLFVWLWVVYEWYKVRGTIQRWGFWLIAVGGLSNILDRWLTGAVRDFIYYPVLKLYGNLADVYLTIGVGMLGAYEIWHWRRSMKGKNHEA